MGFDFDQVPGVAHGDAVVEANFFTNHFRSAKVIGVFSKNIAGSSPRALTVLGRAM